MRTEPIHRDAAYEKTDFLQRVGLRQAAWRTAKRQGLRTIQIHGRAFVRGEDWLDYLHRMAQGFDPESN